jgi:hypothetical protein
MKHPDKFDWSLLIAVIFGCAIVLMLTSCGSITDTRTKEVQTEQTTTKTSPILADTPVGQITIQPTTVTVERRQVTDTTAHASTEVQPAIPPGLAPVASGLLGLVPGVGGILAAGLALWSRSRAMGALKSCTEGIEAFTEEADEKEVAHLHTHLSRKMDKSHKDLIRKVKP